MEGFPSHQRGNWGRCFAVVVPRQRVRDWLSGHELAFQHCGGVTVASDALVSIDGSRYSVPAHLAGTTVTVR